MTKQSEAIYYQVSIKNAHAHLFGVTCTVECPDPRGQIVELPSWIPGSYMIRDFAKNIVTLSASTVTGKLVVNRHGKSSWLIEGCSGPLVIEYEVYSWDLSVRTAYLDQFRGYFNGTSLFLSVKGKESLPCMIEIAQTPELIAKNWSLVTAMRAVEVNRFGFGSYSCENYDELIDHPVEMAQVKEGMFLAEGVRHRVVFSGRTDVDIECVCADLQKICEYQIRFFGPPAPIQDYLFLTLVVGSGYGGLEHRASTSLICNRDDLPRYTDKHISEGYRSFLGLCSHEYFHTWNIKRIKPERFFPYDLSKESHTKLLWVFEGFTSYYDELILLRSGVIEQESYLELLAQSITRMLRGSGRFKQSVSDSSFDAWTKFYKQDENAPNAIVSYYIKGALIALLIDLSIRKETASHSSLDDVMHYLWLEYGQLDIGIGENEMADIIKKATGVDLTTQLENWVSGTEELPLNEFLVEFGVEMVLQPAQSQQDKGGKLINSESCPPPLSLGARYKSSALGIELTHVFDAGSAQLAGLAQGDELIALDGIRLDSDKVESIISHAAEGSVIKVHAFRRDELLQFDLYPVKAPLDTCVLKVIDSVTDRVSKHRSAWLGC